MWSNISGVGWGARLESELNRKKNEVSHSIFLCNFKSFGDKTKIYFFKKVLYLDIHFRSHLKGWITSSKKPPKILILIIPLILVSLQKLCVS